ncbi:MAG: NYN domain-containing protein [Sneathiellaceae bacterium]
MGVVTSTAPAVQASAPATRVRIFIDFWNFSLSLRRQDANFMADWSVLGHLFSETAGTIVRAPDVAFEAMHVYGSFDPAKQQDMKFRNWFTNWLDKQPGVHVTLLARQKKVGYPKCPQCQAEVAICASCNGDMRGTEEKGIDTRIVADMISLAWANAYDVAVLISADRDFVPVAEFLQTKGIKVIHGAFPPNGNYLSQKCWASMDLIQLMPSFCRT